MSHFINISVGDVKNLEKIKERLLNEFDSEEDEEELTPWVDTVQSILNQAYEDGA